MVQQRGNHVYSVGKKCPHSKLTVCTCNRLCIALTFISTASYVAPLAKQAFVQEPKIHIRICFFFRTFLWTSWKTLWGVKERGEEFWKTKDITTRAVGILGQHSRASFGKGCPVNAMLKAIIQEAKKSNYRMRRGFDTFRFLYSVRSLPLQYITFQLQP